MIIISYALVDSFPQDWPYLELLVVLRRLLSQRRLDTCSSLKRTARRLPILDACGYPQIRLVDGKVEFMLFLFDLAVSQIPLPEAVSLEEVDWIRPVIAC